jgi:hypothetical protein
MSCSQLAKTGISVREAYRAALLSTEAAPVGSSADTVTRDLVDFFTSQLPNQSWLLTYRSAVEKHLLPQQEQITADSKHTSALPTPASRDSSSVKNSNSSHSSGSSVVIGEGLDCSAEHLAEIVATIAALPIQVVQPLPIGKARGLTHSALAPCSLQLVLPSILGSTAQPHADNTSSQTETVCSST